MQHRQVEEEFRRRLQDIGPRNAALSFPYLDLPPLEYWQKNFFSVLFLSVFEAVGIPKLHRDRYGLILHGVRGVVTATDNILDGEDNGPVRLDMKDGRVLPNVLLILLQDGLIHQVFSELDADGATTRLAWSKLMSALAEIAEEESDDERATNSALPPNELLRTVHCFRGGRLLELAFVVPEVMEPELADRLGAAKQAVHQIGLALQILDDVTDLSEDVERRNHNILRSWIVHRGTDGHFADEDLTAAPPADLATPERSFPEATAQVLSLAFDAALDGFDRLHQLGHVIDRASALSLIGALFRLRGLQHLWDFWREVAKKDGRRSGADLIRAATSA